MKMSRDAGSIPAASTALGVGCKNAISNKTAKQKTIQVEEFLAIIVNRNGH